MEPQDTIEAVDVVVGAGSGMGAAVASRLAGGRRMVVADRNSDTAERVAGALGGRVEAAECDMTDVDGCKRLAAKVDRLGRLVVTAGLSPTMADATRILDVNLAGVAQLLDAFDATVGSGTAAVVFASMAAHVPFALPSEILAVLDDPLAPDLAGRLRDAGMEVSDPGLAYMLSKLGVVRLARRTAAEWWPRGARIVSVSPGIIDTPMGQQELEQQPMMAGTIESVGRMGTPGEVAAVACFLVSEDASFVSGIDVLVDGGAGATTATAT